MELVIGQAMKEVTMITEESLMMEAKRNLLNRMKLGIGTKLVPGTTNTMTSKISSTKLTPSETGTTAIDTTRGNHLN
jgi:hypothetical protein